MSKLIYLFINELFLLMLYFYVLWLLLCKYIARAISNVKKNDIKTNKQIKNLTQIRVIKYIVGISKEK